MEGSKEESKQEGNCSGESSIETYVQSCTTIASSFGSIQGQFFFEENKIGNFNTFITTLIKIKKFLLN